MNDTANEFDVSIERILPKGLGMGHVTGQTIFVPLTAVGDTVRVAITSSKKRVLFGEVIELIEPGPTRVTPPCPKYGECGGCDLQHIDRETQIATKVEIVRDCFARIGKFEHPELIAVANDEAMGYRTRARIQIDRANGNVGFFRRDSNDVVDLKDCPVLDVSLNAELTNIRENCRDIVRAGADSVELLLADDGVLTSAPTVLGDDTGSVSISGHRYKVSARSFFQGNLRMLDRLIEAATDRVSDGVCLDLYCGVGLFTLPLAASNKKVIAVESSPIAWLLARENVCDNLCENVDVIHDKVGRFLSRFSGPVDTVLVDPPRLGLVDGVIQQITRIAPRNISYVSCEPSTLARDLAEFVAAGYVIDCVNVIDLFPQTHHVETVVRLNRVER